MNGNPHLLAIVESKLAQVRTNLEHNSFVKAQSLLAEVDIYARELQSGIDEMRLVSIANRPWQMQ